MCDHEKLLNKEAIAHAGLQSQREREKIKPVHNQ
jgi:hypothetical protein